MHLECSCLLPHPGGTFSLFSLLWRHNPPARMDMAERLPARHNPAPPAPARPVLLVPSPVFSLRSLPLPHHPPEVPHSFRPRADVLAAQTARTGYLTVLSRYPYPDNTPLPAYEHFPRKFPHRSHTPLPREPRQTF